MHNNNVFPFRPHRLALAVALSCAAALITQPAQAVTGLGTLGGTDSYASGISADGNVVVGHSGISGNTATHAFRWAGGVTSDLGTLGGTYSEASDVSADGSVVVGYSDITGNSNFHAFRWTGGVMSDLGTLVGTDSIFALAVSADGNVVVGGSFTAGNAPYHAFRWTQVDGMQDVATWLAAAGVTLPVGWTLEYATGVSSDGSVLVGYGTNPAGNAEAWLARADGLITDIPAFNASLVEAGARGVQAGVGMPNLALFGAHHRSLLDSGLARSANGVCGWATADAAHYNATDTRMEVAEVGVCKDVDNTIGHTRFGLGVGQNWAKQDWSLGGGAEYDGQHVIAEVGNTFANGMEGSVLAYYGRFDSELRRNYMNGAAVDTSSGTPDAESTALRLRVDWKDVAKLGQFSLSPYAAYTWMETKLDAYTETGGGFPAQFAASKWTTNDLRLGAAAKTALNAATDLRLGLEAAHRFEGDTNGSSGSAIGLPGLAFNLPGQKVKQTWARATLDVDHRLSDTTVLTFGANAATSGGDASWGVTAGVRANF